MIKLSFLSIGLLLSLSAVACAPSGDDAASGDEADSTGSRVTPGEFELGDTPHSVATDCDVHTHLSLKDSPSTATLTEVVGGMCRLAVQPNERTYKLHLKQTDCGSLIYTGSLKDGRSITITDNRARTCEDVIEALVVVQETSLASYDSTTKTMYSRDPAGGAGQAITVTGKLVHTVGIGGENTGSSIQNADGTTELVLDGGEVNQFVENKTARVTGTVTYLNGVETHNRKAIDVTEIVVCPDAGTTLNCMPGPTVRLSNLCSNDNQTWVKANCPGVSYVF